MNNSRLGLYLQSIRGPVLLMTLGALCALHQADIASFRVTWPVLIIVVGVLVLGERLVTPPVVGAHFQTSAGTPGVPPAAGWQLPNQGYAQNPYAPRDPAYPDRRPAYSQGPFPVNPENRPPVQPENRPTPGTQQGEPR